MSRGLRPDAGAGGRQLDPAQPMSNLTTLAACLHDSLGLQHSRAPVVVGFGIVGLTLTAIGAHGPEARPPPRE